MKGSNEIRTNRIVVCVFTISYIKQIRGPLGHGRTDPGGGTDRRAVNCGTAC